MTTKNIFVDRQFMTILQDIVRLHKLSRQTLTIWQNFEEQAPIQIYSELQPYSFKMQKSEFGDKWKLVCKFLRDQNVLRSIGNLDKYPTESLHSDILQELIDRIEIRNPSTPAPTESNDDRAIIAMLHQLVQHIVCRMNMNLNIDWAAWIELKEQGAVILNLKDSQDLWKKAIRMVFSHKHFIGSKSTVDHDLKIISTIAIELQQKIDAANPVKVGDVAGPAIALAAIGSPDIENTLVTDLHRRILQSPMDDKMEIKVPSATSIRVTAIKTSDAAGSTCLELGPAGYESVGSNPKEIEDTLAGFRDQLTSEFKKSIGKGPKPFRVAVHIVRMMAGEYADNNDYQNALAGLINDLCNAGKHPIRYVSWMECSRILERARAIVKGIKPRVDSCMLGEYVGIFEDLDKEKP